MKRGPVQVVQPGQRRPSGRHPSGSVSRGHHGLVVRVLGGIGTQTTFVPSVLLGHGGTMTMEVTVNFVGQAHFKTAAVSPTVQAVLRARRVSFYRVA